MAGVIPGKAQMLKKFGGFGYRTGEVSLPEFYRASIKLVACWMK